MKGLDVRCPGCRNVYHETTEAFKPHKTARGDMLRLKDPWRKWGWSTFDNGVEPKIAEKAATFYSDMTCPSCGAQMAPSGFLTVRNINGTEFIPGHEPEPIDNTVDGKLVMGIDYSDLEAEWNERRGFISCPKCGKQYTNTEKGLIWYGKHVEACK